MVKMSETRKRLILQTIKFVLFTILCLPFICFYHVYECLTKERRGE